MNAGVAGGRFPTDDIAMPAEDLFIGEAKVTATYTGDHRSSLRPRFSSEGWSEVSPRILMTT